jgi:hypothetical protein
MSICPEEKPLAPVISDRCGLLAAVNCRTRYKLLLLVCLSYNAQKEKTFLLAQEL